MRLSSFHVQNYRSVNDSGEIRTDLHTALVGRNESGKTNLLSALASLKPTGAMQPLSYAKDFPRDRMKADFSTQLPVVTTTWELTNNEQRALGRMFTRASAVTRVVVSRPYEACVLVEFDGLTPPPTEAPKLATAVKALGKSVHEYVHAATDGVTKAIADAHAELEAAFSQPKTAGDLWAKTVEAAASKLAAAVASAKADLPSGGGARLEQVRELLQGVAADSAAEASARSWVGKQLPTFLYFADYPELEGHQNIPEYNTRLKQNSNLTKADRNFAKLCKVAGLDPRELESLLSSDHETRQQLVNRAGAVVTKKLRQLWKDRELKVRFNLDGQHFDTLVSDASNVYDVEINLNERSFGFKWFFSFYIAFAADTQGGEADNAVLLFDEPGLHLHAVAQGDLLRHFETDFKNQIIFTTHSPFMIPVGNLASVRTVNISQEHGTQVTNDPTGDAKTLFPIQTALGYEASQALFVGPSNVVVEGVTDYWYLSTVSDYLIERGRKGLAKGCVLTPAGGAQKVSYMTALLSAQRLGVVVLMDDERRARASAEEMLKERLIRKNNIVFVTEGFDKPPTEADIEDLLEPGIFDQLVQETYAKDLAGRKLQLNEKVPRIAVRYEQALQSLGIEFNKSRPARLFLQKMATEAQTLLPEASLSRFEKLVGVLMERLQGAERTARQPFA